MSVHSEEPEIDLDLFGNNVLRKFINYLKEDTDYVEFVGNSYKEETDVLNSKKEPVDNSLYDSFMFNVELRRGDNQLYLDLFNFFIKKIEQNIENRKYLEGVFLEFTKTLNNNRLKYGLEGKMKQLVKPNSQLPEDVKDIVDQPYSEKPIGGKTRKSNKTNKSNKTRKTHKK